jgi:hypothetical protein
MLVLVIAAIVGGDWLLWRYRHEQIVSTVSPIASQMGGLWGWPFGHEYFVLIERPVTDAELAALRVLNHPPRWSFVGVLFRTCDMNADRLEEVRRVLSNCAVSVDCEKEPIDASDKP